MQLAINRKMSIVNSSSNSGNNTRFPMSKKKEIVRTFICKYGYLYILPFEEFIYSAADDIQDDAESEEKKNLVKSLVYYEVNGSDSPSPLTVDASLPLTVDERRDSKLLDNDILVYDNMNLKAILKLHESKMISKFPVTCHYCLEVEENDHDGIFEVIRSYYDDNIPDFIADILLYFMDNGDALEFNTPCISITRQNIKEYLPMEFENNTVYKCLCPSIIYAERMHSFMYAVSRGVDNDGDEITNEQYAKWLAPDIYRLLKIVKDKNETDYPSDIQNLLKLDTENEVYEEIVDNLDDIHYEDIYYLIRVSRGYSPSY